jgi:hypothetical protein
VQDYKKQFSDPDPVASERIIGNMSSLAWVDELLKIDLEQEQIVASYRETVRRYEAQIDGLNLRRAELRNRVVSDQRRENRELEHRRRSARVYNIQTVNIQNYQE